MTLVYNLIWIFIICRLTHTESFEKIEIYQSDEIWNPILWQPRTLYDHTKYIFIFRNYASCNLICNYFLWCYLTRKHVILIAVCCWKNRYLPYVYELWNSKHIKKNVCMPIIASLQWNNIKLLLRSRLDLGHCTS